MSVLLDIAYLSAGLLLAPWVLYRFARGERGDFARRFGLRLGAPLSGSIWLHGASAGEVSLLKPLIALLERDRPGTPLVISAVTSTGLAAARKLYPRHRVVPLPFDLSFVVRRCLARWAPELVVIVESELWPNLILSAHRRSIPLAIVNGKMSAKSQRRHARTRLIPHVLRCIDLVAVQTDEHAERLRSLGVAAERIRVTGNMKYDLAPAATAAAESHALRERLGYAADDVVVIGGSVHDGEDEALLEAFAAARAVCPAAALILVPRYPDDVATVVARAERRGHAVVRKTQVDAGTAAPGRGGVLVVDTVGELGRLYGVADAAFVGGSLFFRGSNKGGHNLMEPAILGVPVVFGPYNFSFKETVEDLLAASAGRLVRDAAELAAVLVELCTHADERRALGARGRDVVVRGKGATERNYELLAALLPAPAARLQAPRFDRRMPHALSGPDSPS